jgi:hypothetical protein
VRYRASLFVTACEIGRSRFFIDICALIALIMIAYMLLILAHLVYSLYCAIRARTIVVYRWFIRKWYKTTECDVLVHTQQLDKVRKHLVIIFERVFDVLDCIRIIGWCITLDIPYISFFDRNGKKPI